MVAAVVVIGIMMLWLQPRLDVETLGDEELQRCLILYKLSRKHCPIGLAPLLL